MQDDIFEEEKQAPDKVSGPREPIDDDPRDIFDEEPPRAEKKDRSKLRANLPVTALLSLLVLITAGFGFMVFQGARRPETPKHVVLTFPIDNSTDNNLGDKRIDGAGKHQEETPSAELEKMITKAIQKIEENLGEGQTGFTAGGNDQTKPPGRKPLGPPAGPERAGEPPVQKSAEPGVRRLKAETHAKRPGEVVSAARDDYVIPYLASLIRRSAFQEAAETYRKDLAQYTGAYTVRLEVVCQNQSLRTAFEEGNFDPRMYILPKKLNNRDCFGVFWGIFPSLGEARREISALPVFFTQQPSPPVPVLLDRYL